MIRVTNIKKWKESEYDKTYLIIRSIASLERQNNRILNCSEHVPDLNPSRGLFYRYLDWAKQGHWNQSTFDNEYKPTFIAEIANNPNAAAWFSKIETEDSQNMRIALLCFCADENLCHRIIIGEMLKQHGCNVIFDRDTNT